MTLIDILDMYCILHNQNDNMMLMLQDYTLDNRIDRQAMNMAIITKLGACRPLTTNTTVFKVMLEEFFNRYNYNISKLLDTMYYKYDPLHDKDTTRTLNETGTEDHVENDTEHRESTGDIDNTDTYTTNNTGSDNIDRTDENQVSAYDVSTYQPKEKTITSSEEDTTNNTTHTGATTSDIKSDVSTEHDRTLDKDTTHNLTETIKGKNSDISYQTLIEQERELGQFNIFNWIIQQMRRELFLLVY